MRIFRDNFVNGDWGFEYEVKTTVFVRLRL